LQIEDSDKNLKLLRGCIKKDRDSQKELYKEYYGYGMSICLRYADNREDASEILNDSFLKVFTHIDKFNLDKPFRPWLRKVIINTAINHFRKKQKDIKTENLKLASNEIDDDDLISNINYQEMVALLQKLSPAYRTVFNLYVLEGFTHEEIGRQLGISEGTSKSNLHKAKAHLKIIFTEYFESQYVKKA
jgi:RNA polymerase sigma factor (sigma-70 family)